MIFIVMMAINVAVKMEFIDVVKELPKNVI